MRTNSIKDIFLNTFDIKLLKSNIIDASILHIGNGLVLELDNLKKYKLSGGFGIGDYFLKIEEINQYQTSEYHSVKTLGLENLIKIIDKNPSWIVSSTFHGTETVLTKLMVNFSDEKNKILFIGSNFETSDTKGKYEYFDGAWVITNEVLIENTILL